MLPKNFPYRKELKRNEAKVRLEEYQRKTPQQILSRLDSLFGEGLGAKRQRTRLAAAIPETPAPAPTPPSDPSTSPVKNQKRSKKKKSS